MLWAAPHPRRQIPAEGNVRNFYVEKDFSCTFGFIIYIFCKKNIKRGVTSARTNADAHICYCIYYLHIIIVIIVVVIIVIIIILYSILFKIILYVIYLLLEKCSYRRYICGVRY